MKNKTLILLAILLMVFILSARLHAQKLPGVQKTSVYAPSTVKTDGKTVEWGDKFEAQNNATNLCSIIANNDEYLYLTIQGQAAATINKMMNGGITFTIKSDDKAVKPVVLELLLFQKGSLTDVSKKINAPDAKLDSLLGPINQQIAAGIKEIGIKGVNDIADTLISVYNEYGIKEAAQYDVKKALNCEIAIPLKYIRHLIKSDVFKYNIKLNAIKMRQVSIVMNGSAVAPGSAGEARAMSLVNMMASSGGGMSDAFNDTDFSGTYTLAKKL